ncbi:hypothetical protein C8R45DRAFT_1114650 [Mycena sanguinolenta]|nr:hypothetical protein C8R45DRAFT_1114650 [Mycena sanguinolenta]
MSNKRGRSVVTPTPPSSPTRESSTDIDTTSKFLDRYNFEFDDIPVDKPPLVKKNIFWVAINTPAGYDLLKFAFRVLNPDFELSKPVAFSTLEDALPVLRYAMSRLNPVLPVPPDIGCFLAGIGKLVKLAGDDTDVEWGFLIIPELPKKALHSVLSQVPPMDPRGGPITGGHRQGSDPLLREPVLRASAQTLSQVLSPRQFEVIEGWEVERSSSKQSGLSRDLIQLGTPPPADSASSGRTSRRNKLSVLKGTAKDEPDYDKSHPDVRLLLELKPFIEAKMFELVVQNGMGVGAYHLSSDQQYYCTRKQPGTVQKAKSHLGDVDGRRSNKRSETMAIEPIEPLDIEPFRQLDVSEAVQPLIGCFLCRLFELTCYPHGVGIACRNCQRDKHGFLCDHAMGTPRFTALLYDFAQRSSAFLPNVPITIDRLQDTVTLVRCARTTLVQAQQELVLMLRTFFEAFRHQMHIFGETGFQKVLSGIQMDESPVDVFNSLIYAFNRAQHFDNNGLTDTDAVGSTLTTPKPAPDVDEKEEDEEEEEEEGEVSKTVEPVAPNLTSKKPSSARALGLSPIFKLAALSERTISHFMSVKVRISLEDVTSALKATHITVPSPAHIPEPSYKKASTFIPPNLGRCIPMSSGNVASTPAPEFEAPAPVAHHWGKAKRTLKAFMQLDSSAGIFHQIDMADTICAALIPVLAEEHTRQYAHNMATNPETCNLPAPDSFEPFGIRYDHFRDVRRDVAKERTDQAKALAEQEKAEKAKAKAEAEKAAAIKAAADKVHLLPSS